MEQDGSPLQRTPSTFIPAHQQSEQFPLSAREQYQAKIEQKIGDYHSLLATHPRATSPRQWATFQHRLGQTYYHHPNDEQRQAHLEQALSCYQAALEIFTRADFPQQWATISYDLGLVHRNYPPHLDRQAHLEQALSCYQAALEI